MYSAVALPGSLAKTSSPARIPFDSIAALTREATGTELPIGSLFEWLAGRDSHAEGWTADLQGLADGRLVAERSQPLPTVQMRLVLDQP